MRRGARRMGQFRTRLRRSHQIVVAEQRSRDDPARRTQRSDHHIARHNRKNATLRDRNRSRRGRIRNRSNPRRTGGHCFDAEQTCSLNVEESPARLASTDRSLVLHHPRCRHRIVDRRPGHQRLRTPCTALGGRGPGRARAPGDDSRNGGSFAHVTGGIRGTRRRTRTEIMSYTHLLLRPHGVSLLA